MTSEITGMMVIISSPSGAGKTTLVKLLAEKNRNFKISISNTTRSPRENEVHGEDYFFIKKEEFNDLIKKNAFYEYAKVFNNFYGTLKKPVKQFLSEGKDVLFDIDWQGTEQIKKLKLKNKLITIFVLPPSIKILKERLSKRDIKDKQIINKRMSQFKADVLHWKDYDYVVVNKDLNKCYQTIVSIVNSEKNKKKFLFDKKKIKEKVYELLN